MDYLNDEASEGGKAAFPRVFAGGLREQEKEAGPDFFFIVIGQWGQVEVPMQCHNRSSFTYVKEIPGKRGA